MSLANPLPRTVLVTGSAKRLGRDIAVALAQAGWRVAVHYRSSQQDAIETIAACARHSSVCGHFHADLSQESDCKALVAQVIAQGGRLDAVVNSAALFAHDDAGSFSFDNLHQHMATNTAAPIALAQALHVHLTSRGDAEAATNGVVVNLLDQKLWNQNPDFLSYTLSKAALEAANTLLAMALAPRVRVVGVAPGLTLTSHMLSDEKFAALHKLSPLGRSSSVQDVCAAVLFALTNPSITGTTLLVDGGQHLMKFERDFSLM